MQARTKRELAALQRYRQTVLILAHKRAKREVERELRVKGIRTTPAEISALAHDYLVQHKERLIAEAEEAIATWPGFKQWRAPKPK